MLLDFWWLPVVVVACVGDVVAQIAWLRCFPAGGIYRSMVGGFIAGAALLIAASLVWRDRPIGAHMADFGMYVCFAYVYFHWNNMGETGRRVRLLIELANAPAGLTRGQLLARYSAKEIVDRRIGRLLESNQVVASGSRLALGNPSVLAMTRIIGLVKRILRIESALVRSPE